MSRGAPQFLLNKHEPEQDFEINLASIIDCFTVLITYLLVSASFISLGSFDVSVATPSVTESQGVGPTVDVSVDLTPSRDIMIRVTGKEEASIKVAAKDGGWNFDALTAQLTALKFKFSDLKGATLSAESTVEYREIVKAVEVVRGTLPSVSLGERDKES